MTLWLMGLALCGLASCEEVSAGPDKAAWKDVQAAWAGGAEISRYELTQVRYGEARDGEAVLIFVREPFLKDRHVKDDSGRNDFHVLKMNETRSFLTGVYPYSTMVSVFQPLAEGSAGEALKVTTSVQEWCGHAFMQADRREGKIKTEIKSYFEKEDGGAFEEKDPVYLEDEIWTALRIDPLGLPVGKVKMIPSGLSSRLSHRDPVSKLANIRWVNGEDKGTVVYEISYPKSGRTLAIEIQKKVPYAIQAWRESDTQGLLSSGQLKDRESNLDYWNYSSQAKGKKLRSKLGF